jgi:glycosyltransferase involved in cell wall biosynthesis
LRILVVNHYAVPANSGGGTRHTDLAVDWARAGHEVTILASNFNHFDGARAERLPANTLVARGVRLRSLWTPGYVGNGIRRMVDMAYFAVTAGLTTLRSPRPDVILGSSPHPFAAAAAFLVARIRRIPFVFEVRDLWPRTLVDLGGLRANSVVTRLLYRLESMLVRRSDATVGIPPAMAVYLLERSLRPRRYVHIPNGANDFVQPATDHGLLSRYALRGGTYFAYAGSLGKANGVQFLVDAIGLIPSSHVLLIMGDGPERAALEERAKSVAPGRVIFTGQLAKNDALMLLSQAKATVFHLVDAPVFRYGLSPNKLIDYLSIGRPIVYAGPRVANPASASGAVVEAVSGNAVSVADAFSQVAAMTEAECLLRGEQGRQYSAAHHRMDVLSARYLSLFEEIR